MNSEEDFRSFFEIGAKNGKNAVGIGASYERAGRCSGKVCLAGCRERVIAESPTAGTARRTAQIKKTYIIHLY